MDIGGGKKNRALSSRRKGLLKWLTHLCSWQIWNKIHFSGRVIDLPENYSAYVIQSGNINQSNVSEDETKSIKYVGAAKSNNITVWNYDKEDDLDNPISRGLHWTQICDAIGVSDNEDDEKENIKTAQKWLIPKLSKRLICT